MSGSEQAEPTAERKLYGSLTAGMYLLERLKHGWPVTLPDEGHFDAYERKQGAKWRALAVYRRTKHLVLNALVPHAELARLRRVAARTA